MLSVEFDVEQAMARVRGHAISGGIPRAQAKHLASSQLLQVCTGVASAVSGDASLPISKKNRRQMLRGAKTHLHNAEQKIHYWIKKRKLTVQEMNRRLSKFNSLRCPKIFWDDVSRNEKEARSK